MLFWIMRIALATASLSLISGTCFAQGWGKIKKSKATIRRLLPPTANLQNARINVEAVAQGGVSPGVVEVLLTKVSTLIQGDNRFVFDKVNPDTVLKFVVTRYYTESATETASTGKSTCTYFTGRLEASYTAVDVKTGFARDSANLVVAYPDTSPVETRGGATRLTSIFKADANACAAKGAPSANAVQDLLMDNLVQDLGQRAAPVEDTLELPLPAGKLANLSLLAEQQRWAALAEEAEKATKLEQPNDDAYRYYLIGFANEVLAYDMSIQAAKVLKDGLVNQLPGEMEKAKLKDREYRGEALKFVEKSYAAYQEAMKMNPREKEFSYAQGRAEKAQTLLAAMSRREREFEELLRLNGTNGPPVPGSRGTPVAPVQQQQAPPPPPPAVASADDQLLTLCRKKVPTDMIVEWVGANRPQLTFGPANADGLVKLSEACGPNTSAIGAAIRGTPAAAPPTPHAKPTPRAKSAAAAPKGATP